MFYVDFWVSFGEPMFKKDHKTRESETEFYYSQILEEAQAYLPGHMVWWDSGQTGRKQQDLRHMPLSPFGPVRVSRKLWGSGHARLVNSTQKSKSPLTSWGIYLRSSQWEGSGRKGCSGSHIRNLTLSCDSAGCYLRHEFHGRASVCYRSPIRPLSNTK